MSNGNGARNGNGRHAAGGVAARRRNALIVGAIVLGLLAFGGGYLLARNQDASSASPSAAVSRSPKPTKDPPVSPSASASGSVSPSASASASVVPSPLEDGRHFVFLEEADTDGGWSLRFDLAYFYLDQDAIDECGQDVPNGYCIVNDNPKIRTLPVNTTVAVRYIPTDDCCALQPGTFPALAAAVDGTSQGDYEPTAPYWITVSGGHIVRIAQQFLP